MLNSLGSPSNKREILRILAQLYDEVEAGQAQVVELSNNLDNMYDVTRIGDSHKQYIGGATSTINLVIQRNNY